MKILEMCVRIPQTFHHAAFNRIQFSNRPITLSWVATYFEGQEVYRDSAWSSIALMHLVKHCGRSVDVIQRLAEHLARVHFLLG